MPRPAAHTREEDEQALRWLAWADEGVPPAEIAQRDGVLQTRVRRVLKALERHT